MQPFPVQGLADSHISAEKFRLDYNAEVQDDAPRSRD